MPTMQWVYRLVVQSGGVVPKVAGFRLITNPLGLGGCLGAMRDQFGWSGVVKTMLKLMAGRRYFYLVMSGNEVAHFGWVMKGYCRFYPVEPGAVVIGPVETVDRFRGKGLATEGVMSVVHAMRERGHKIFYIDTADTNLPMQRVIGKCGFGAAIATYPRGEGMGMGGTTNLH